MKGIILPERTEDFTADPVELFFDLAYVFAFSQIVSTLINDPTWSGVGEAALVFALLWLPWQQLTWAANAVSGNGRRVRLIFLAATVASVPMAAATSDALGDSGTVFAVSLAAIMCLGFAIQSLVTGMTAEHRSSAVAWILPNVAAIVVLVVGSTFDGNARLTLWLVAALIVLGAMVLAGRGQWLVRVGHMAERHGLIVIIALGEVIVAIGLPVLANLQAGEGLPGPTLAALIASGVFACMLWWGYFDRPSPALEHYGDELEGDNARGRWVRDVYTWAHAPIVAGIIVSAAALEEMALHPSDPVPASFRMMLLGGLALFALGISAAVWRTFRAVARERVLSAVAIAALLVFGSSIDAVVLLIAVVAIMAFTLVVEHQRIEK
ncbi:MAG: low temperature requirement protein A [Actinomycetia bacterium]|nr:low temperature requirement protein A [Actinomycetes bacterium]